MVNDVKGDSDGSGDNLIDALIWIVFFSYVIIHLFTDSGFEEHFIEFLEIAVG